VNLDKLLKKEMTRKEFLALGAFAVVSMFGVVGLIRELSSRAATPTADLEAEDGVVTAPATKQLDATASGGSAVKFGTATDTFVLGTTLPTTANTGLLAGWTKDSLTPWTGGFTFTTANTTYKNYYFNSQVTVQAANVRFENCWFACNVNPTSVVGCVKCNGTGTYLYRCHMQPQTPHDYTNGIIGYNYTAERCRIEGGSDSINTGSTGAPLNIKIYGCLTDHQYFTRPDVLGRPEGSHQDCIQIAGGSNVDIWGNAFRGYIDSTVLSGAFDGRTNSTGDQFWQDGWAAGDHDHPIHGAAGMQITQDRSVVSNVRFRENWCYGGATCVNVAESNKGAVQGLEISGNRFSRDQRIGRQGTINVASWNAMNSAGLFFGNVMLDGVGSPNILINQGTA
jgi:hypothetical protein